MIGAVERKGDGRRDVAEHLGPQADEADSFAFKREAAHARPTSLASLGGCVHDGPHLAVRGGVGGRIGGVERALDGTGEIRGDLHAVAEQIRYEACVLPTRDAVHGHVVGSLVAAALTESPSPRRTRLPGAPMVYLRDSFKSPSMSCLSRSRSSAAQSTLPSACIGVTRATILPVIIACLRVNSQVADCGALYLREDRHYPCRQPEDNLMDIRTNIRFGCTILSHYLKREKGNMYRALARYNGSVGKRWYPNRVFKSLSSRWYKQ